MNNSIAVFLINKNVRAVVGLYEPETSGCKPPKRVTFKTFDREIQVGDFVVVPSSTRHGLTTFKIVDVDVDVDFDSHEEMKWIVCRVDQSEYIETIRKENAAISAIKSAEKRKKADELRAALIIDQDAIKTLAISSAGDHTPDA